MRIKGIVSRRLEPPAPTIRSLVKIPNIGSQYILGRDVINKYKLIYQAPTHEVYLEQQTTYLSNNKT